jgi:diacylglycerol kinase (ATP)
MIKNKNILESFVHAAHGLSESFSDQRNVPIILIIGVIVVIVSLFLKLSVVEYMILSVTITLVLMAELFNAAIENTIDLITQEFHPLAKAAKDIAATAVMVTCLNAVIVAALFVAGRVW